MSPQSGERSGGGRSRCAEASTSASLEHPTAEDRALTPNDAFMCTRSAKIPDVLCSRYCSSIFLDEETTSKAFIMILRSHQRPRTSQEQGGTLVSNLEEKLLLGQFGITVFRSRQ
ncbi:hypothetical protein VTI74DRAFT_4999 [Chaetomium olivicolor]